MNIATIEKTISRFTKDGNQELDDELAIEEPLEIGVRYTEGGKAIARNISVTMRTPGNDGELATGFLFTEGIVQNNTDIESYKSSPLDPNRIVIQLKAGVTPKLDSSERNFYTTSSCGVCGKASVDAVRTISRFHIQDNVLKISSETLLALSSGFQDRQQVFERTGGLHASALFDLQGKFITLREDVGRHNALDKLIGASFANDKIPLTEHILLLSGRASFELIQKASMAGIAVIAAIGAPSSLAVQLAEDAGITLIGFLRSDRYNIYTGAARIV